MKRRNNLLELGKIFFLSFVFLIISISFIYAIPQISFVNPTPEDGNLTHNNYAIINVSITESDLEELIYNWNGTNYTLYNESLVLMINFGNLSSLGENNTLVFDVSNSSNNGTCTGNSCPNWSSSGKWGGAFVFDGSSDYFDISDNNSLDLNTTWTISAWIKRARVSNAYERIFYKFKTTGNQRSYGLYLDNSNRLCAIASSNGTSTDTGCGPRVNDTDWHYIAFTFNNGNVIFYVDSNSSTDTLTQTSIYNSTSQFRIGANVETSPSQWFNGTIDEIRVWNTTLSSTQINQSYMFDLRKSNSSFYNFYINQTKSPNLGLDAGNYTYQIFVKGTGTWNFTERRYINYTPVPININYPLVYNLYQRHNETTGEIIIFGNYTGSPSLIEARFNGGSWVVINSSPSGGIFTGRFNESIGQGTLEVRFGDDTSIVNSVANIGIGDLYVIAGQSNAEGRATNAQSLNDSNLYISTTYREDDSWIVADDPIDNGTIGGSPFPLLANKIIQNQSIPVGFISTAKGGTTISQWQKGQIEYNNMYNQINEATNGTMRVKTILFHQGETDAMSITGTNYSTYKSSLNSLAEDFLNDTQIAEFIILVQIGEVTSTTVTTLDDVRKAQSDFWEENESLSQGISIYDITPLSDGVHLKTDSEIQELADRYWVAIGEKIYEIGDGKCPKINNITMNEGDNDTITLNFTEDSLPLKIGFWNGTTSSLAKGFNFTFYNGSSYGDEIINSTEIIDNNKLMINLTINITSGANVTFGSFNDGVGRPVVIENSTYSLPSETFYNHTITFLRAAVVVSSFSDESSTSDGGILTFKPTQTQLKEGYLRTLRKLQKIQINLSNGELYILKINEVNKTSGEIVINANEVNYSIAESSYEEIDFNSDNYYDLNISVLQIYNTSYAKIKFSEIHEEILEEDKKDITGNIIWNNIMNLDEKSNVNYYVLVTTIVLVLIISIFFRKIHRRR